MIEKIKNNMVYFISFAIIGWIYEVCIFLYEDHIFVNRGFLYGPWLPVYGFGGIIIYYLFYKLKKKPVKVMNINIRPLLIFIYITITAMLVELTATYICDILKFDWRTLWNYNKDIMNFQGRIALIPGLKFGLIGVAVTYLIIPLIDKIKNSNNKIINCIVYTIIIIFIIDVIIHIFTGSTYVGPV
ncbi:MAG: putative ABC transporter permease [Bacilli bacterium]|nr:putative ABC transporter permease [Bacilli bacterium]